MSYVGQRGPDSSAEGSKQRRDRMWPYRSVLGLLGWEPQRLRQPWRSRAKALWGVSIQNLGVSSSSWPLSPALTDLPLSLLWQELMSLAMTHPQPLSAQAQPV